MSAVLAAIAALPVPSHTQLRTLREGARFRFCYLGPEGYRPKEDTPVCTNSRNGWYRDENGRAWRTGRYVAVQEVREETP